MRHFTQADGGRLLLAAGAQDHQHQRRQNPTKKPFHCVTPNRFLKTFLQPQHQLIHHDGRHRKHEDGRHHEVHVEHLRPVDDQIAETGFGDQKFAHDDADPRQADVHAQRIEERGIVGRDDQPPQDLMPGRAERLHQADLLPVRGQEADMHIQDRDKDRDRDRHGDDRLCARANPDDEHRAERRFRQRVEHDQIRVEHAREQLAPPQADGDERAEQRPEHEANHNLEARRADVQPQLPGSLQAHERVHHARRAADDEGIHPAEPG